VHKSRTYSDPALSVGCSAARVISEAPGLEPAPCAVRVEVDGGAAYASVIGARYPCKGRAAMADQMSLEFSTGRSAGFVDTCGGVVPETRAYGDSLAVHLWLPEDNDSIV
jgi:hypothetical protein